MFDINMDKFRFVSDCLGLILIRSGQSGTAWGSYKDL